jgi:hypothetical protein
MVNRGVEVLDVYVSERLLVARPIGIVNLSVAEQIVEVIEIKEEQIENGFDRFCDLTCMEGISLSCAEVFMLASRRRAFNPNSVRVKSAFLATNPLAFGMARMYEQMLNSPRIEVRVWIDFEAAANWLGVESDLLMAHA